MLRLLGQQFEYLLHPSVWITIALAVSFFAQTHRLRLYARYVAAFFFFFFSNGFAYNEAMRLWELPQVPLAAVPRHKPCVAVVLGGGTDTYRLPQDRTYLARDAERVVHAIELYDNGLVEKFVLTGGYGHHGLSEAASMRNLMISCGVDSLDIVLEPRARDTHENATLSAAIVRRDFRNYNVIVITSAYHARRARLCFAKQGVDVFMFPTDVRSGARTFAPNTLVFPNDRAFSGWATLLHELVGMVMYKLWGYA